MSKTIVINPLTRVSGYLEIAVEIENHRVVDAKSEGLMFRGFEAMLVGRNPLDAIYFSERICGICSTAHSVASAMALEMAMNLDLSEQGRYLRDLVHGCEFLQNHIRHFYQYTIPDYVKLPDAYPFLQVNHGDFRLPEPVSEGLARDYFDSLAISRSAHQLLAILGGKAPHNHGVFVGGISTQATVDRIIQMRSILTQIQSFIRGRMLPDVQIIGEYYPEYYENGVGHGNLLSYGCFDRYPTLGTLYVDPLVKTGDMVEPLQPDKINENLTRTWYVDDTGLATGSPYPTIDREKKDGYSFIKGARYQGLPYEVGPLARQWLSGEYRRGISTLDRTVARVREAEKITVVMDQLLEQLIPDISVQQVYQIPDKGAGRGLIDTTRGALGHWLSIENQTLAFYQIITPSVWNLSPIGAEDLRGPVEQSLIGATVEDEASPVEIGRIVRSFDPCVSCATHIYRGGSPLGRFIILP